MCTRWRTPVMTGWLMVMVLVVKCYSVTTPGAYNVIVKYCETYDQLIHEFDRKCYGCGGLISWMNRWFSGRATCLFFTFSSLGQGFNQDTQQAKQLDFRLEAMMDNSLDDPSTNQSASSLLRGIMWGASGDLTFENRTSMYNHSFVPVVSYQ